MTPLTKMHTLAAPSRRRASTPVVPLPRHGAHGVARQELGLMEAVAYTQNQCFEAGVLFARSEGIVPAPEANHAVKGAIEEALRCKREGKMKPSSSARAATATSTWRRTRSTLRANSGRVVRREGTGHGAVWFAQRGRSQRDAIARGRNPIRP